MSKFDLRREDIIKSVHERYFILIKQYRDSGQHVAGQTLIADLGWRGRGCRGSRGCRGGRGSDRGGRGGRGKCRHACDGDINSSTVVREPEMIKLTSVAHTTEVCLLVSQ